VAAKETQAKEMDYNPNIGLPSPQSVGAEFSDSETPPSSQTRPKLARRTPATVVDTDVVQEISTSGAMESTMPNISDDMDTQNIGVSEAKASGMTMHASVLYVPPTYTQAAVHNNSHALGAPLSVANRGLGQGYHTAGIQPKIPAYAPELNTGLAVSTVSSLSTGNIGLPFYSAYATPHLATPVSVQSLMPHSAVTSPAMTPYFSAPVLPVATSVPQRNVSLLAPVAHPKAETQPTFVGLGAPLPFVPTPMDTKCLPLSGAMSAADVSFSQATARENLGQQTSGVVAAPTVIIKQPEPVRPYTGATSYRAYKEYFLRICACNGWTNSTDCAPPFACSNGRTGC